MKPDDVRGGVQPGERASARRPGARAPAGRGRGRRSRRTRAASRRARSTRTAAARRRSSTARVRRRAAVKLAAGLASDGEAVARGRARTGRGRTGRRDAVEPRRDAGNGRAAAPSWPVCRASMPVRAAATTPSISKAPIARRRSERLHPSPSRASGEVRIALGVRPRASRRRRVRHRQHLEAPARVARQHLDHFGPGARHDRLAVAGIISIQDRDGPAADRNRDREAGEPARRGEQRRQRVVVGAERRLGVDTG